jgi:hypothetical protein
VTLLTIAAQPRTRSVRWDDLPASVQRRLVGAGLAASSLPGFLVDRERRTSERVRESDLDALIYYALQSTTFTKELPIEPALSAKAFVEGLDAATRARFLAGTAVPDAPPPSPVARRLHALADAVRAPISGTRLAYFKEALRGEAPKDLESFLRREYARAMWFLYEKEFVAQQRSDRREAIAALYRERGLSTDTAAEAGYLVHAGLATLKALDPARRIRRVLIVGPGLDLAPRTGLLEVGPPASYQPYAVVDALVSLGLSTTDDLIVIGADVNPRVVDYLRAARNGNPVLTLVSGIGDTGTVTLQDGYRTYSDALGRSIGEVRPAPVLPPRYDGHLRKSVRVRSDVSRAVDAVRLDIAAARLERGSIDLVVATNIFPYLDDVALTLALTNIASMLASGGVLLHNEPRELVGSVAGEVGLPLEQARTGTIATVQGAPPLADSVFVHLKR